MNRQPAGDQRRSGRMIHSAFAGCFPVPSIGICRMNYRHSPDVFLLSRVTSRLAKAKIQHSRLGLQSFLQSISVKQSRRTAFKKLGTTTDRPGVFYKHDAQASEFSLEPLLACASCWSRSMNDSAERAGRQATQEKTRSGRELLMHRREIANSSPECRRLRGNSGERSSTDDSA